MNEGKFIFDFTRLDTMAVNDLIPFGKLQNDGSYKVKNIRNTDFLNELIVSSPVTRAELQALISSSGLIAGKFYTITNAVGGTLSLLVQAVSSNLLGEYAVSTTSGETYKYDISTDTAVLEPNPIALGTANQLLGVNAGGTAQEYKTLSGTTNQVTVTHSVNGITLSLPQNIHTGATPTFAGLTLTNALTASNGGTGQSVYAVGDILFASTTTALSRLAGVATGNALISGGVNTAPSWGKIGLTTHVSGTLGVANGGTGLTATPTNGQIDIGNGTGFTRTTLTGTANQVTVTNGSGTITLSLPQSIATTSSPTFAGLSVTSGSNGKLVKFGASGVLGDSIVSESGGVLGVGVTPSAWGVSNKGIETTFGTSIIGRNDLSIFGRNFFYNSGDDPIYANNGPATGYFQTGVQHLWYSAPSGTAGTIATLAEAMKLTSTQLVTFGAPNTSEAHIFGGSARVNGSALITGALSLGTGNAVTASVATPSTHKVQIVINGTTYYLLASNV